VLSFPGVILHENEALLRKTAGILKRGSLTEILKQPGNSPLPLFLTISSIFAAAILYLYKDKKLLFPLYEFIYRLYQSS